MRSGTLAASIYSPSRFSWPLGHLLWTHKRRHGQSWTCHRPLRPYWPYWQLVSVWRLYISRLLWVQWPSFAAGRRRERLGHSSDCQSIDSKLSSRPARLSDGFACRGGTCSHSLPQQELPLIIQLKSRVTDPSQVVDCLGLLLAHATAGN